MGLFTSQNKSSLKKLKKITDKVLEKEDYYKAKQMKNLGKPQTY